MSSRLRGRRGGLAAVAGAIASGVVLVTTASAASFTDPMGDVAVEPPGATLTGLDITGIEVANSGDQLTFRIALAGAPAPLPPDSAVAVVLDTDKNASTGDEGTDAIAALFVEATGKQVPAIGRYDLSTREFGYTGWSESAATYSNGTLVLSFPRFMFDNTRGFTFGAVAVVASSDTTAAAVDVAPDAGQAWAYELVDLPPLLTTSRAIGEPPRPRAGKSFTATSEVRREDSGELVMRGTITCVVRVNGEPLQARGRFTGVGARCAMTVPRNTRGRTLRGTMTIRSESTTTKRSFTFRVI